MSAETKTPTHYTTSTKFGPRGPGRPRSEGIAVNMLTLLAVSFAVLVADMVVRDIGGSGKLKSVDLLRIRLLARA